MRSIAMFTSGPTVHARLHPGEYRRFVFADLLRRYLEFRGYSVTHVINITDLEDKTIEGSDKAGERLAEFTERNIQSFKKDMDTLGVKPAAVYPRAGEHVEEMVRLTENLVKKDSLMKNLETLKLL